MAMAIIIITVTTDITVITAMVVDHGVIQAMVMVLVMVEVIQAMAMHQHLHMALVTRLVMLLVTHRDMAGDHRRRQLLLLHQLNRAMVEYSQGRDISID